MELQALQAYRGSFERTNRQDCEVANEYKLAIRDVTRSMTREQLADFIVSTLDEYEVRARKQHHCWQRFVLHRMTEPRICIHSTHTESRDHQLAAGTKRNED